MGSGAPDHQLKIRITDAFGYVDKIPVYEVAPVTGRYYASPTDLTESDFAPALLDIKGRLIVKAILDSTSATIDVNVTDKWARQLGLIDLSRVLGAALAHTNPVIVRLTDGTSAFIDPRQATVQNWPANYPDSAVATLLGAGLPAALDGFSLKVKEQSPITTIDVTDKAARLLGEVDNLKKWGSTALTGRDISGDLAKLVDIETNTDGLLKTADLSIEVTSKHLEVDVKNYPATYPDTDIEPRNVSKWGGTALTGRDISGDLSNLDVALSTKARLQHWYQANFAISEIAYQGAGIAPHASTTRATYTCPASRIAQVNAISLLAMRDATPTTAGIVRQWAKTIAGNDCPIASFIDATLGARLIATLGSGMMLIAADTILIKTSDVSTGGTCFYDGTVQVSVFNT